MTPKSEILAPDTLTPRQVYQSLIDRLAQFRQQVRARLLLEGVARLFATALALALVTFLLDRLFRLSFPARLAMLIASAISLCLVTWHQIITPLTLKLDPLTLAAALDRIANQGNGYITSRIATILELPATLEKETHPSLVMLHYAAAQCHAALSQIDFDARLDNHRKNLATTTLIASLLLPLVITLSAPATTRLWAARVLAGSNQPWPQKTYLQISGLNDGVIVVPRGEPYVLRAQATQGSVVPNLLSTRYREADSAPVEANFATFGPNDFRYEFPSINAPVRFEVSGGDASVGPFILRPADRPRITDLKLTAQHPTEKNPTDYDFNGETDLSFLPRTHLHLQFTANTPIAEAHLKSSTTQPANADLTQIDDRHFSIDWQHNNATSLQIDLTSKDAHLAAAPTMLTIGLKVDQPPRVTLSYTGVKLRITPRAKIPLTIDARDDLGIASAALITKTQKPDPNTPGKLLETSTTQPLYGPVQPTTETEIQPRQNLSVDDLKLPIGSLLTVNASATDACYIGSQTTASRQVTFRLVAPEELFREILLRQQAERAKFRKQADECRSMREQMNLANSTQIIQQLSRRQRALQHEVLRINTSLADSLTEMQLNQLGTDEAYDLMQKKVLVPLKQLNDELLNPQKDALDTLQPTDASALKTVQSRQDDTFDRMNQILHQMSQWDSFVDVLNQLNEVIKLQDQAQHKTNELKKNNIEGVFDK